MSENVRIPQQQRSIDKKKRIIDAGYELFAKNGYFNTNTVEIAKLAGVSTGIVYGYFHDKRDILIEVLDVYINNVFRPVLDMFDNLKAPLNFHFLITYVIDRAVEAHSLNAAMHETLHSLTSTDKIVNEKFLKLEDEMTKKIISCLVKLGYRKDNLNERVHLTMEMVQSYAHECVFDKHSYIDYAEMRKLIVETLEEIFE